MADRLHNDGRAAVLAEIAARVPVRERPVRVAVDGVDGAGKTVFAEALAQALRDPDRPVVHASVDGFHRPRAQRYARGRTSAEGFYRDSYDYDTFVQVLLEPFAEPGRRYCPAVWDVANDAAVQRVWRTVEPGAVLVVDGIFLHRPQLRGYWDLSVFLDVPFDVSVPRLIGRDGGSLDLSDPSTARYVDGQRLYAAECRPREVADIVVDNSDWAAPRIVNAASGEWS